MRKLNTSQQNKKSKIPAALILKAAGFVIFVLSAFTLITLMSFYNYTSTVPGWSTATTAAGLFAGGAAIKLSSDARYTKHLFVIACVLLVIFLLSILLGSAQWPSVAGLAISAVYFSAALYNMLSSRKK